MKSGFAGDRISQILKEQKLRPLVGHMHIADASGIDGESLTFGHSDAENIELFARALDFDRLKVIEV